MLISGKCCVYKKGVCPLWLSEGFLHWNDEDRNNVNKDGGSLPEGVNGSDTRIFFCCRTDGDKSDPVPLRLSKPFYLLVYGSSDCQLVKGAITTSEYIIFDNEAVSWNNHQLFESFREDNRHKWGDSLKFPMAVQFKSVVSMETFL